jgi:hypothetical protein
VLWEISFTNLNMLLATIPKYEPDKEKKNDEDEVSRGSKDEDLTSIADFLKIPK